MKKSGHSKDHQDLWGFRTGDKKDLRDPWGFLRGNNGFLGIQGDSKNGIAGPVGFQEGPEGFQKGEYPGALGYLGMPKGTDRTPRDKWDFHVLFSDPAIFNFLGPYLGIQKGNSIGSMDANTGMESLL